jgi:hypothetical protein
MPTDDELIQRCNWVAAENTRNMLATGNIDPDFYFAKGPGALLYHLRFSEIPWAMNNGRFKEIVFAMVRLSVEQAGYDCVICCTECWMFRGNQAFTELDETTRRKLTNSGFEMLQDLGYGTRVDAFVVTGQTPERACIASYVVDRDLATGKVRSAGELLHQYVIPIENFDGRQKMFGPCKEPGMQEAQDLLKSMNMPPPGLLEQSVHLVNIATEAAPNAEQ